MLTSVFAMTAKKKFRRKVEKVLPSIGVSTTSFYVPSSEFKQFREECVNMGLNYSPVVQILMRIFLKNDKLRNAIKKEITDNEIRKNARKNSDVYMEDREVIDYLSTLI